MKKGINSVNKKDHSHQKATNAGHSPELLGSGGQPHEHERQEINGAREKEKREVSHAIKGALPGENISNRQQKGRAEIDPHEETHERR